MKRPELPGLAEEVKEQNGKSSKRVCDRIQELRDAVAQKCQEIAEDEVPDPKSTSE